MLMIYLGNYKLWIAVCPEIAVHGNKQTAQVQMDIDGW